MYNLEDKNYCRCPACKNHYIARLLDASLYWQHDSYLEVFRCDL
ncbi:DUF3797 domain-containing protein [Bacillus sp. ISL-41]|nr:DUF3797 domain-containing protein [Bacillus sp. ISL-41]